MKNILEKFKFRCIDCNSEYAEQEISYLCPKCSQDNTSDLPPKGVLKVVYNYDLVKDLIPNQTVTIFNHLKSIQFISLLPIINIFNMPALRVGNTPLYSQNKLYGKALNCHLFLKDDSQNPTYSFKDRASALVSAYAKEQNFQTIIAASTGNAGSSLAGICASQNQSSIIFVPENAPKAKLTQIVMYGAKIIPVKGTYDDAFDLSVAATEKYGFYNRNTAYNPFTVEGKKTVSFEIFEQLNQQIPDRIFVPVGDGVIISGVYKGFEDLLYLGIIEKIPKIVAVQSYGSDNLIRNVYSDSFKTVKSKTSADSISVDIPRNFYMAKEYITTYKGECIGVSDEDILSASKELSVSSGLFAEPAAAASFAGFLKYLKDNKIEDNSNNVVLLTGSGLKDLQAVQPAIHIPDSVNPNIEELNSLLSF